MSTLPNHETNNVVILGSPENIRRFVAEAFVHPGQPFPRSPEETNEKGFPLIDFDLVVPEPENIEKGGCNGQHEEGVICWYTWHLENWGTKWGAYSHEHYELRWMQGYGEDEPVYGRVDLRFETAWSQPVPILEAIGQRWDLEVHAVTQDEGGYPDVEYGDPYDREVLNKVTTFEFSAWDNEVDEPEVSNA